MLPKIPVVAPRRISSCRFLYRNIEDFSTHNKAKRPSLCTSFCESCTSILLYFWTRDQQRHWVVAVAFEDARSGVIPGNDYSSVIPQLLNQWAKEPFVDI